MNSSFGQWVSWDLLWEFEGLRLCNIWWGHSSWNVLKPVGADTMSYIGSLCIHTGSCWAPLKSMSFRDPYVLVVGPIVLLSHFVCHNPRLYRFWKLVLYTLTVISSYPYILMHLCMCLCSGPGHSGRFPGLHSCCDLRLDPRGTLQAGPRSIAVRLQRGYCLHRLSAARYDQHTGCEG